MERKTCFGEVPQDIWKQVLHKNKWWLTRKVWFLGWWRDISCILYTEQGLQVLKLSTEENSGKHWCNEDLPEREIEEHEDDFLIEEEEPKEEEINEEEEEEEEEREPPNTPSKMKYVERHHPEE